MTEIEWFPLISMLCVHQYSFVGARLLSLPLSLRQENGDSFDFFRPFNKERLHGKVLTNDQCMQKRWRKQDLQMWAGCVFLGGWWRIRKWKWRIACLKMKVDRSMWKAIYIQYTQWDVDVARTKCEFNWPKLALQQKRSETLNKQYGFTPSGICLPLFLSTQCCDPFSLRN